MASDPQLMDHLNQLQRELQRSKIEKKQPHLVQAFNQARDLTLKALEWEAQTDKLDTGLEDARQITQQLSTQMEQFLVELQERKEALENEFDKRHSTLDERERFIDEQETKLADTLSRLHDIESREGNVQVKEQRLEENTNRTYDLNVELKGLGSRNTELTERLDKNITEIATSLDGFAEVRAQINRREEDIDRRENILDQ